MICDGMDFESSGSFVLGSNIVMEVLELKNKGGGGVTVAAAAAVVVDEAADEVVVGEEGEPAFADGFAEMS